MIGYIYKVTNKVNGKTYVGKKHSEKFDPSYFGSGILIRKAILKYGKENFTLDLIAEADTIPQLNELEKLHISLQDSKTYNIAAGGDGGNLIENHPEKLNIIEKRSESIRRWHQNKTSEETEIWKSNISKNRKGNYREGYVPTESHKQKSSLSNKMFWENLSSIDRKAKLDKLNDLAAKRKGIPNKKCYKKIMIDNVIYEGLTPAAKILKVTRRTIHNWIKSGKAKYVH